MPNPSHVVAIGLPEAGKTTFLAALWHVAEREEVPRSLRLERISEDAKYLNTIRNEWLRFERVGRTVPGQEESATLWLRDEEGGVGEVIFPDLSGESFERAWVDRQWTEEYRLVVATAGSLLLFVNPATVKEPHTIAEMQRMAEAAFPGELDSTASCEQAENDEKTPAGAVDEWSADKAPTQVQLVELLQFAEYCLSPVRPIRLAVIISAWDLVKDDYLGDKGPANWLKNRLSYLDQYLKSNFEQFILRVYGVSAQGGDLKTDRELLQSFERASERILIEGLDCIPHDISEPIRWCLRLRKETAR